MSFTLCEGGNPDGVTACAVGMAQVSARENSPRCALWMRLDSRLRGNDAVWCGEGFSGTHEPLCFSVTGPLLARRAAPAANPVWSEQ